MPVYEYEHCSRFDKLVRNSDDRDRVSCSCGAPARRLQSSFSLGNITHVADNYKNIEFGTGVRGIETLGQVERALKSTGTQPVDAYYRAPKPPPPKEVTLEELAPYLDGMPLNNE